jgi:hypothetical protein
MTVDLNALRKAVLNNQQRDDALPTAPSRQVVVDREGNVKFGSDVQSGEITTQVPQETFAITVISDTNV